MTLKKKIYSSILSLSFLIFINTALAAAPALPNVPEPTAPSITQKQLDDFQSGVASIKIPELQVTLPGLKLSKAKDCNVDDDTSMTVCIPWLGEYIAGIYNYIIGIAGILATILLMYGGFRWTMAGGSAKSVSEAQEIITGALVGIVLAGTSYLMLNQISPQLTVMKPITIPYVIEMEDTAMKLKGSSESGAFSQQSCPSSAELSSGVSIYSTGYMKPTYGSDLKSLCKLAMNCTCPAGRDTSKNCDAYFPGYKNYAPCKPFDPNTTAYCNATASGGTPKPGTIAAPSCMAFNSTVCVTNSKGIKTTYTVTDRGSGITGKRIDIWSSSQAEAISNTGAATLKSGSCN